MFFVAYSTGTIGRYALYTIPSRQGNSAQAWGSGIYNLVTCLRVSRPFACSVGTRALLLDSRDWTSQENDWDYFPMSNEKATLAKVKAGSEEARNGDECQFVSGVDSYPWVLRVQVLAVVHVWVLTFRSAARHSRRRRRTRRRWRDPERPRTASRATPDTPLQAQQTMTSQTQV